MASHIAARLALFKYPAFVWYFLSCFAATVASGLFYVNVTWWVVTVEHSVSAVALVFFCFWSPVVLLSPIMGVLVDRLPRARLLTYVNMYRGGVLVIFLGAFFFGTPLWVVYLCVLLQGVGLSLALPVTFGLVREFVPEKLLLHANATVDIGFEVGNVLGMGCAGAVIFLVGFKGAFLVNALCYGLAALCSARMPLLHLTTHGIKSVKQVMVDYKDGLVYVAQRPNLFCVYGVQVLLMAQFMTIPVLVAPFATQILHATVGQFGMIEACLSVGVIAGGIWIPWIADQFGHRKTVFTGLFCLIALYIVFIFTTQVWLAQLVFLCLGFSYAIWPIVMTSAQSFTELSYQGRVQSTFNVLTSVAVLFVYWCLGVLGQHIPVNYLYVIQILFTSIALLLMLRVRL